MKISDIDSNIALELLAEMGSSRVVKGVNTTNDVHPGEIKRQSAKLGFNTSDDGYPPIIKSDGKFKQTQIKPQ